MLQAKPLIIAPMYRAPTVAHSVWLPAPRGGRCACGLAKPVPRPLLAKRAFATNHLLARKGRGKMARRATNQFKFEPWNRLRRATGGRPPRGAGRYTK